MKADAVIVAAGASTRFGDTDKLLVELCGVPVIAWSLAACEACEAIDRVYIVTAEERLQAMRELGEAWAEEKLVGVIPGGARRRDSVEAGLRATRARYVAIHDGARPLVSPELMRATVLAAEGKPGAIAAVPVVDTIKEVDEGLVTAHPERSRLWAAQTPQVVLRQAWLDAAASSDNDETDDAAMLARLGLDVTVVEGDSANIKITRPLDLEIAAAIMRAKGAQPCA